ncbi:alpha/beta hydrolase [Amycolatopsis thailandensis]|uniref:alpha/beta hydrolase n=1 Tax=Amycolatopsis thailandensis TaxID=589330 RepID=UPI003625D55A
MRKVAKIAVLSTLTLLPLLVPVASGTPRIQWESCANEAWPTLQCAELSVPLRGKKDKDSVKIPLAKLPAADQSRRIGSLLTNPGGPGSSGVKVLKSGGHFFALDRPEMSEVLQRFDIIGFDPRGVGGSSPAVACPANLHDPAISRFPQTLGEYDKLVQHNRSSGEACLAKTGPLLSKVDTWSAADDIEAIRIALGESKINWLGLSYGTELGAVYAEKYPNRIRTMVLDGAVDHSLPTRRALVDEAIAIEDGLHEFARWCESTKECELHGKDVIGIYKTLTNKPGGVPSSHLGRNANSEELSFGVYDRLYLVELWPVLAKALVAATAENPDAAGLTVGTRSQSPSYPAYRAIGCHDFGTPFTGYDDMKKMAAVVKKNAPLTWRYSEFWDWASGCLGWPVQSAFLPQPQKVRGAAPILVVGGAHDPATPLRWAEGLARNIENSALLVNEGPGHTGLLNSACVRAKEADYLVTARPPVSGTVCQR